MPIRVLIQVSLQFISSVAVLDGIPEDDIELIRLERRRCRLGRLTAWIFGGSEPSSGKRRESSQGGGYAGMMRMMGGGYPGMGGRMGGGRR